MKNNWIRTPFFDILWILSPAFIPGFIVLFFADYFFNAQVTSNSVSWVVLVLLVDVGHVYSTLYRTYFSKSGLVKYNTVLKVVPVICLFASVLLYSVSELLFWRCMAYLAVFHFIRQQYGFMRIYSRNEELPPSISKWHSLTIYSVTLLPILIWHSLGPRNFNWFVENDFMYFNYPALSVFFKVIMALILFVYVASEVFICYKYRRFNWQRIALILGSAFSWYVGIVVFNGDLIFTMLNVVAHGLPYIALIWAMEKNKNPGENFKWMQLVFKQYGIILFALSLISLAYFEEGLWDALVWREQKSVFSPFYFLSALTNQKLLTFVVPLLSLPQLVHYVLDGFIWKSKKMQNQTVPN